MEQDKEAKWPSKDDMVPKPAKLYNNLTKYTET